MRRRGYRPRGRSRPSGLLARLRDRPELGLRDLQALDAPSGSPDGLELGFGRLEGGRVGAVVVAQWEGPALLGWARVAALLADDRGPVSEMIVAAPVIGPSMRAIAAQFSSGGAALRLVSVPTLSSSTEEALVQEIYPRFDDARPRIAPARTLLGRVVRVLEGAAALTGVGAVRPALDGFVLYMHGVLVLQLGADGEGVAATFVEPEKRQVRISELNFVRWGTDLQEHVVRLAKDRRLLERSDARQDAALEEVAARTGVRVTARWLPWNLEGTHPIDWVGIDGSARPVIGLIRRSVGLSDVPAICSALALLVEQGDLWVPGAVGPTRLLVSAGDLDPRVETALSAFGVSVERAGEGLEELSQGTREDAERERRGRRRPRRRRRPRAEPVGPAASEPFGTSEPISEELASEAEEGFERLDEGVSQEGFEPEIPQEEFEEKSEREAVAEVGPPPEWVEAREPVEETPPVDEPEEPMELEIDLDADTLAAVEDEEPGEVEPVHLEPETPRPRRARAAIVVRNEVESILAALVLARERRHVVLFWVCHQEQLMEFFKTAATDLGDNVDVLLVGFTAEPVPREILDTVELYRGRIQWFDHHPWPIEDQELLREAIGREAIVLTEGAASPLASVMSIAERRSRFTDKLMDLSSRRLPENDMQKWGYAVLALLQRLAATTGDHRQDIVSVLAGKPASLPAAEDVCAGEVAWAEGHDPRVVHFGEYQMAVVQVPEDLDAGEVARLVRLRTGCRLSLASRDGDATVMLTANEEKRHINVQGLAEHLLARLPWLELKPGGDRAARFVIDDLPRHPERLELVIGAIADHKSVLQG